MTAPLIITLQLDPDATGYFNQLRRKYYPAYANMVDAHLTLFHRLPNEPVITDTLLTLSACAPFPLQVTGLQRYTNGLAYTLTGAPLQLLHQSLQQQWQPWLIWRDQQPLQPHITIMNKVTAFKAQQLHEKLLQAFQPFEVTATGFGVWEYRKGPWKQVQLLAFSG